MVGLCLERFDISNMLPEIRMSDRWCVIILFGVLLLVCYCYFVLLIVTAPVLAIGPAANEVSMR